MPAPHVIVVGLGVAGSSIAATLAQRGFRVTGIEQFSPLHVRGSSHGDTRIFRRVPHEGPVYVEMARASFDGWRAWNILAKDDLFVPCGGIDAGPERSGLVQAAEQLSANCDLPFEVLDGAAYNRRHPHFRLPAEWRVVYQPSSGYVRPDATRTFLHQLAREAGARMLHETSVLEIEAAADRVAVRTAHEVVSGDFLVVAAGSWLPGLFPELRLALTVERRVIAWFQPLVPEDLSNRRFPIFCLDAGGGWYGMPTPDRRVKVGHDKHFRQRIDPDAPPIPADGEDAAMLSRCVREYLAGFAVEPSEMKPCLYTLTEDHHFLIDWHPSHANMLLFSCCSGHGFKYAPAYGEIAADLVAGKARPELDLFRLSRGGVGVTRFS